MRSINLAGLAGSAMLAVSLGVGAAAAGSFEHDHVYADSFGNLVIDSAAGYKRIIVGQGHRAKEVASYTDTNVKIVYADRTESASAGEDCYRAPALIKGRSYMYGFDQGVIPFQGGPCE